MGALHLRGIPQRNTRDPDTQTSSNMRTNMRIIIAVFIASLALAAADTDDVVPEVSSPSEPALAEEENLMAVVKSLKGMSKGTRYHSHGKNVEYHAKLLQKARAYKHSLAATSAIKAAIRALTSELTTGHNHDKNALKKAKTAGNTAIVTANNKGTTTCAGYRKKACPTKKKERDADVKKKAAKAAQQAIKKTKVCPISTTWKDMGVRNSTPRFGTVLRNSWDKQRSQWLKRTAEYNAAKSAHDRATRTHTVALAPGSWIATAFTAQPMLVSFRAQRAPSANEDLAHKL